MEPGTTSMSCWRFSAFRRIRHMLQVAAAVLNFKGLARARSLRTRASKCGHGRANEASFGIWTDLLLKLQAGGAAKVFQAGKMMVPMEPGRALLVAFILSTRW